MRHFPRPGSSRYLGPFVVLLAALCISLPSSAQTLTVLHTFQSRPDGLTPVAAVIMDENDTLYGTTARGGMASQGTVYKLESNGDESVLHSFVRRPDGLGPEAGLVFDSAHNLYGTTEIGGSLGKGTIFKVEPDGTETILHDFSMNPALGANPVAGLIFDNSSNLYGTAQNGGDQAQDGTVFKLTPPGDLIVLHAFNGRTGDGRNPMAKLFLDTAGNFYGTTYQGGTHNRGTVFEIDAGGTYRVVYRFAGGADGKWPSAGVIIDITSGNLYGTTSQGGAHNGGTVFKIDPSGNETVVHSFGARGDGQFPQADLVTDGAGNIYGTTVMGGASQQGTVFKIDTAGNYSVLHSFRMSEGVMPGAAVIIGNDGNLYGTTSAGGPGNGSGTVFKLSLQ
jgi:uncharacterized repeat protein (TIGR03803 family)